MSILCESFSSQDFIVAPPPPSSSPLPSLTACSRPSRLAVDRASRRPAHRHYAAAMTSWLKRTQAGIQSAPTTPAAASAPCFVATSAGRIRDPNAPDARLDIESCCIYERRLPGNAYITAHVTRLQDGFYDSPNTHGDCIDNVRFLAVNFVFHPSETINRFQAATVTIGLHDDTDQAFTDPARGHKPTQEPPHKPKFLRFAPHVLFGGVSPETLDWNFNLTGSLGVSQTPVSASISPSGGVKGSDKLFQMMRIQGSTRTLFARHDHEYDVEDGEVCWTMEENSLQKSGLPREMTFVMLITKGDVDNVVFDINIEPKVASWFGHYPGWWNRLLKYRPLQKEHLDLDRELGQRFAPEVPGRGFNFANLAVTFNDFVSLPGTTYSLTDQAFTNQVPVPGAKTGQGAPVKRPSAPSRQNTQPAQVNLPSQSGYSAVQRDAQTVSPPRHDESMEPSEAPMDYHIYLHNPRTINLHASPPPPPLPTSTPVPNYSQQTPIHVIQPDPTASHQRVSSPANTKMKRRSIDISNLARGRYYDEAKTPQRNTSGSSVGSLRRRRSKTDLRAHPLAEESESRSGSSSSSSQISRKEDLFPLAAIPTVPSPPDPGLSGFKARLQAYAASERERLPFEIQPEAQRPPRDITPSPDPTDDPNSDTTDEFEERSDSRRERKTRRSPETLTNGDNKPQISPAASSAARKISPYADVKWDEVRHAAQRRESSASLSPDEQPRWGDLREEQRRKQRKRMSVPAYSYITEADGEWENR